MRISSIIPCVRNANGSGHEQRRQTDGPGKDEVNRMNDFRKTAQEMLEFIRISPNEVPEECQFLTAKEKVSDFRFFARRIEKVGNL